MPRITLVYFDAGGGHRNACFALREVLATTQPNWDLHLFNLQEELDHLDPLRRVTGIRLQDYYNLMLERGWTFAARPLLAALHATVRLYHRPMERMLCRIWEKQQPDMVLSVIPNFNRVLAASLRQVRPAAPFVTLLTDIADYPPHFWIERESEYLICGSERAVGQALAIGHSRSHIFRVGGMVLHPRFYSTPPVDRAAARRELGLDPGLPTAVVLFGGFGSDVMFDIARRLDRSPTPLQLILICGRNEKLAGRLRAMPKCKSMFIEGFTSRVAHYLALSDFFIGKPGPGSLSEALHFGLPVIVEKNARTLPQERYNADWIVEREAGICLRSFRDIANAVDAMLAPGVLAQYQAAARATSNRAVFEAADALATILSQPRQAQALAKSETWKSDSSLVSSWSSKSN